MQRLFFSLKLAGEPCYGFFFSRDIGAELLDNDITGLDGELGFLDVSVENRYVTLKRNPLPLFILQNHALRLDFFLEIGEVLF